ncbi:EF-P 5-aminopentanol modification-associated protein YfmF [Caldicellulosiruptoraceae bacterium PP1]
MLIERYGNNKVMIINDQRFKINRIGIAFIDKLEKFNNTLNALFPMVLIRGNNKYKDLKEINKFCEMMYGASLSVDVSKKGDLQIINFSLSLINDNYSPEPLINKAIEFLYDIIYGPINFGGGFNSQNIEQEKNNLKLMIESRINDKVEYAIDRCIEIMFEGDNFALFEKGDINDLENINKEILYNHYVNIVMKKPFYIYAFGDYNRDNLNDIINRYFDLSSNREVIQNNFDFTNALIDTKYIKEEMEVNQGKLSIGIRTNIDTRSDEYYKLILLNGILGTSPKSKLFENVREKASLCYYAFSRLDKFKPMMIISSGIEVVNYDKALSLIIEQIEDIKKGNITKEEYESTINYFYTMYKSVYDSPRDLVNFYFNQSLIDRIYEPFEIFEFIRKHLIEDIVTISNKLVIDTVYFLKNREV